MKALSSICLSIPWWYVLGTQKHVSDHEYTFLVINALLTIASMVHRHFNTKLTRRLDYTMICAIQFSYHLFSDIYCPILLGFLCHPYRKIVFLVGVVGFAFKTHNVLQQTIILGTMAIGIFCHLREKDNNYWQWPWHISNGLIMLYTLLFSSPISNPVVG